MSVFHKLPRELIPEILSFVIRPDWRTCKQQESTIIQAFHTFVLEYLVDSIDEWSTCRSPYYNEIDDWTLYGKNWLAWADKDDVWASRRPPLIPPTDRMYVDKYYKWYEHRIKWLNG